MTPLEIVFWCAAAVVLYACAAYPVLIALAARLRPPRPRQAPCDGSVSIILAAHNEADKIGRRRTVLGCITVMAAGMFMATTVRGLVDLSIWRVITGLGIGGMLAAINAVSAEFSNTRRRDLSVSLMSTRLACHAGADPNSSAHAVVVSSANRSTGTLRRGSASAGSVPRGNSTSRP